ncbi:MAG: nucleotidyl transferase AbiEii/AbiGii toxin family protein [Chromatiales bacterium]|nr:nucleotidyl transferase AbiEii/AbiGii toxin family protein [Chromatiales bacterium]
MTFVPRLDILPDEQRALWPALSRVPKSFVLYGGTAIALRLGHRVSVDFDFFSSEPLDFEVLLALPFVRNAEILQQEPATLTISTPRAGSVAPVKVSFFGDLDMGRVGHPQQTDDGVVWVAAMPDLFATKLKVLLQRIAARDYEDIAAMLRSGIALEDGLGAAVALYGAQFPPMEAVKTLAWFEIDDARNVGAATRELLSRTAANWRCAVSAIAKSEDRRLGP